MTNIFLLCYNESALLPHTIKHYRNYLPNSVITIYDNESTDNSAEIAISLGCKVVSWSTNNITNEIKQRDLKNNCWKNVSSGWVIIADMDEYLYVTESDLLQEMNNGVSILSIRGINIIGESKTVDLSDIDLQNITKYSECPTESKNICFFRQSIKQMNYSYGAHLCKPKGNVVYSKTIYINRHMNFLGLEFYIDKVTKRYSRNEKMRTYGMNVHYTNDIEKAKEYYNNVLESSLTLN